MPFTIPFADEQTPQYQSPRGFSAREEDLIKKENDKYLRMGIVEKAPLTCKHASNPVIAAKKDPTTGEWTDVRFCVDYRMVNKRSVRLNYRTLLPEQLFQRIGKSRFITTLDLKNGYHLIPLPEEVRDKTAY